MNKTVILAGISGCRNRGVEALVVTAIDGIRDALGPDTIIKIISEDAAFDRIHLARLNIKVVQGSLFRFGGLPLGFIRDLALHSNALRNPAAREVIATIKDSDLLVMTGGDNLSSDYGTIGLRSQLDYIHLAASLDVPVFLLGQSIGPFRSKLHERMWADAWKRVKMATFRESISFNFLKSKGLLDTKRAIVTADPAFRLEPLRGPEAKSLYATYSIQSDSSYVVVAPSAAIARYKNGNFDTHRKILINIVRMLMERGFERILLMGHVSDRKPENDDHLLAGSIARDLGYPEQLSVIGAYHTASELKTLICNAKFLFTERMHAGIAALSSGVPTLLVGYSVKASGILNSIFPNNPECSDISLISFEDLLTSGLAIDKINKILDTSSHLKILSLIGSEHQKNSAKNNYWTINNILK